MARRTRCSAAGYDYHVLNRAVGRATLFAQPADFAAFEKVLRQGGERSDMRLLSYLAMPNHWHLGVWPRNNGELSPWPHRVCRPVERKPLRANLLARPLVEPVARV